MADIISVLLGMAIVVGLPIWLFIRFCKWVASWFEPEQTQQKRVNVKDVPIRISFSVNGQPYERESEGNIKWAAEGEKIKVKSYEISSPLTYYSNSKSSEPSCINTSLPVGSADMATKERIGYWPEYSELSSNQRAKYLTWLHYGKQDPVEEMGYVFIYFYGLERRAIVEKKDSELIVSELLRLLNIYSSSGSFQNYASELLAYIVARDSIEVNIDDILKHNRIAFTLFPIILSQLAKQQKPLNKELAYLYAKSDYTFKKSVVVERVGENFKKLFFKKFEEKFPQGLELKANKSKRYKHYHAATPSYIVKEKAVSIPIIEISQLTFKPLIKIWEDCIEELTPLSRTLSKGKDLSAKEAYKKLPPALRASVQHPDMDKWVDIMNTAIHKEDFSIIKAGSVIEGLDIEIKNVKLTKKESLEIVQNAEEVGYLTVPDIRITGNTYTIDDYLCFYKGKPLKITKSLGAEYMTAVRFLALSMAVAAVNREIDETETNYIAEALDKKFNMNEENKKRLEAYKEIFLLNPPSIKIVSKLKTKLTMPQKEELAAMIVGVMIADNSLDKEELKALQTLFKTLGIEEYKLYRLLFEMREAKENPVEFIGIGEKDFPEAIRKEAMASTAITPLNYEKIKQIHCETQEVSKILTEVLSENIDVDAEVMPAAVEQEVPSENAVSNEENNPLSDLDERYHAILLTLIKENEWTKDAFNSLIREHSLMPAGTIEAINTWSDEILGDFIIHEEDSYIINIDLAEKIK